MTEKISKNVQIAAVFKREFLSLAGSAAAWVFLVIFLLTAGFLTFMVSDILATEQADLTPFFNWLPWLFLFIIPALAMPLWSEERRTGTLELTISYPVSIAQLVFGKYLAGLMLVVMALLLTIGIPLTIANYGSPDWNAVLCSYLGALMAGSVCLAVSCFCSALTKSQTAAFLLSLFLCSLLLISGWNRVDAYLAMYLPYALCRGVEQFALLPHYQAFQRGLIDTSELAYCIFTTFLFLYLTVRALDFSTSGVGGIFLPGALRDKYTWKHLGRLIGGIAFALYVYLCLIYASGVFAVRFDITADHAYSITEQSKVIAESLKKNVEIRFYLSESKSEETRPLRQYGKRIEWLLRDFAAYSKGKIRLSVITPEQDSPQEESAILDGLTPVSSSQTGDRFYLGIAVSSGISTIPMNQLSQSNEMVLEYELIRNLLAIQRNKKPIIGVMSPFPATDEAPTADSHGKGVRALSFFNELSRDYRVAIIPMDCNEIPGEIEGEKLEAVVVLQPAGISKKSTYALDQYLLRGGKLMIFLDPYLLPRKANPTQQDVLEAEQRKHAALPELTECWGVRFDDTMKIADLNYKYTHTSNSGTQVTIPDILRIPSEGISRENPATAALTTLLMCYPGAFEVVTPQKGLQYETLVHTSKQAALFPVKKRSEILLHELSRLSDKETKEYPLVLKITGKFNSAFADNDSVVQQTGNTEKHRKVSTGTPGVILLADADMVMRDTNYKSTGTGQKYFISENYTLIQNLLEMLCGNENFARLRTRKALSRPLTEIMESRKKVQMQFSERYLALLREFEIRKRRMEYINSRIIASGGAYRLSEEEKIEQREFRRAETTFHSEEKNLRNQLKSGLAELNTQARLVNIVLIPLSVILLAILWFTGRAILRKRCKGNHQEECTK